MLADAVLLPETGSSWFAAVMVATFVIRVPLTSEATTAVIVSVAVDPAFRSPTVQTPVPETYSPLLGFADVKLTPAGRRSVTATPEELLGPLLASVTVKWIVSPVFGVG